MPCLLRPRERQTLAPPIAGGDVDIKNDLNPEFRSCRELSPDGRVHQYQNQAHFLTESNVNDPTTDRSTSRACAQTIDDVMCRTQIPFPAEPSFRHLRAPDFRSRHWEACLPSFPINGDTSHSPRYPWEGVGQSHMPLQVRTKDLIVRIFFSRFVWLLPSFVVCFLLCVVVVAFVFICCLLFVGIVALALLTLFLLVVLMLFFTPFLLFAVFSCFFSFSWCCSSYCCCSVSFMLFFKCLCFASLFPTSLIF